MSLTPEERRRINRQNAAKSTGPKSEEGKERARQNALKHGLRAEALALPVEDASELRELAEHWHTFYAPESPGEQELVDRAVGAIIQRRRCQRHLTAALNQSVRDATRVWDQAQEDRLAGLQTLLRTDAPAATLQLRRFGLGCRWMIERWEDLLELLDKNRYWAFEECQEAVRLFGYAAENDAALKQNPDAWMVRVYNALSEPNPEPGHYAIEWHFMPVRRPGGMPPVYDPNSFADSDTCRGILRALVETELSELRRLEEKWRVAYEDPERAEAADRAVMLDGPEGGLLLRYERMHESAYHRAYSALLKGRKDAARASESEAPNEAKFGSPPDAPNEARRPAESARANPGRP